MYWRLWTTATLILVGIILSKNWVFLSVSSLKCWILETEIFQGKTDLNQQYCRKSTMKNRKPLKYNGEKNIFLQCWSPWTKLKSEGVNNSRLASVSREMVLKHTRKDINCMEINVSSFLTAIKILIETTQKKKSMFVFSKTIKKKHGMDKYTETNPGNCGV